MKRIKKVALAALGILMLILGLDCDAREDAVDRGYCFYGGQGRDRYGR